MHTKEKQVVVITGATAGVGRAIARAFAKEGAEIALIARDRDRLEETRREIEHFGCRVLIFSVDVVDADQIESAAQSITEEFGAIDIWVNNAMVSVFSPAIKMSAEEFKRVTEVTYLGYVYGTLSALKRMIPKNRGMIIQVGSALAYRGIPLQSAYCGAKHAVQGFTESVRSELIHDNSNVKISMVQLPAMNTPQFTWTKSRMPRKAKPVPPIFQPEVAAQAVVWASKHYRREWYVGFSTVKAIVGDKIAPAFADWYLAKKGYEAQQYNGPRGVAGDNLFKPFPGDFGAHGNFDSESSSFSLNLWLNQRRNYLFFAFLLLLLLFILW